MPLGCALADTDWSTGERDSCCAYLVTETEASVLVAELCVSVLGPVDDLVDLVAIVGE